MKPHIFLLLILCLCHHNSTLAQNYSGKRDSLLRELKTIQKDTNKVNIYIELANISSLSNIDSTIIWAKLGLNLANDLSYKKGAARCLNELGYAMGIRSEYALALKYLEDALTLSTEVNYIAGVISAHNELGNLFDSNGEYDKAYFHYQKSLAVAQQSSLQRDIAIAYNNSGWVQIKQGNYSLALENLFSAEQLYDKVNLKRNYPLNNIAFVYLKKGNYDESQKYAKEAIKIGEQLSDFKGVGRSWDILGEIALRRKMYDSAEYFYKKGLTIKEQWQYPTELAKSYDYIGEVYFAQNKTAEALKYYTKSYEMRKRFDIQEGIARNLYNVASVHLRTNNAEQSLMEGFDALDIAKKNGDKETYWLLCGLLSSSYEKLGDFASSLTYSELALKVQDSLYNLQKEQKMRDIQSGYEIDKKRRLLSLANWEKSQQEILATQQKMQKNTLLAGAFILGIFFFSLLQTNRQREKMNEMLAQQNEEVEAQNEQISLQKEELTQLNATKDKLFSIVSHDIRTPINGLSNMLSLLDMSYLPPEMLIDLAEKLQKNINNVSATIENLLNWSISQMKGIETTSENVSVAEIATEIMGIYIETAAAKRIELINEVPAHFQVYADANHLRLLFRNLISNAIKFTKKEGSVTVSAKVQNDTQIVIAITDTGVGMSQEKCAKLFRVETHFTEQGTAKEKGTGLGLLLCKEFVEHNKGKIWVTSEEGVGSSFCFTMLKSKELSVASKQLPVIG
jgi:two-component system, sensor histidine kinase and response regulator